MDSISRWDKSCRLLLKGLVMKPSVTSDSSSLAGRVFGVRREDCGCLRPSSLYPLVVRQNNVAGQPVSFPNGLEIEVGRLGSPWMELTCLD